MAVAPRKAMTANRSATFLRVGCEVCAVIASQVAAAPEIRVKLRTERNTNLIGNMVFSE